MEVAGKDIKKAKLVINGAGAAAISCTKLYVALGVKKENILMLDSHGVITTDRTDLNPEKAIFATNRKDVHTLEEALKDADVFVGLSRGNILSKDMIRSMASNPIVFALANPVPEISYEDALDSRPDVIMSTGRSDYPNQINNVIGFPYIFRGALDVHAKAINEEMKMAAVHAIADLAKQPIPDVVNEVYHINDLSFGPKYFIPKPIDPRLITAVSAAVAKAAVESGVARTPIKDWDKYKENLKQLLGQESKFTRTLHATAARHPQRIVFAEGGHPTMMKAAVQAKQEGICFPILLGNPDRLQGYTFEEAYDKMYERNYFGMSMVENGDADGFITGLYTKYSNTIKVAKEVIGIRPGYKTFATMHILDTKKGIYYISDTLINRHPDENVLYDIARLSADAVRFFNDKPVMAMISYSNFGTDTIGSPQKVHAAVEKMQQEFPDLAVDGEMQVNFAMDKKLRDDKYPFTRLKGKNVNTLIFSNMSSANGSYKLLQALNSDAEIIGPIQMGLKKPIHFTDFECSVRDIVNITAVAAIDAYVEKIKNSKK